MYASKKKYMPNLKPRRAPIHELDRPLRLDLRYRRRHVLRNHITPVQQTTSHVLAVPGVALDHLVLCGEH